MDDNTVMPRKPKHELVSERLRSAIQSADDSRYRIAQEAGIEQSALSRFLSGERGLSMEAIDLLDIFTEDPIPEGKKSVTLRLTYRSFEGTLKDEAINVMHAAITQKLVEAFGADLPA